LEQNVLLANRLQVVEFEPGQIVFHMGEMGDTFYIVEKGEVEVLAPDVKGMPSVLNRLGPTDFFGEIALLRAVPRTATIRVVSPTRLLAHCPAAGGSTYGDYSCRFADPPAGSQPRRF
jgi:CRP-like cAMP-binding protein